MNIPVYDLHIDHAYQRAIRDNVVSSIEKNYDSNAFGVLIVAHRSNGSYFVIDGQQRLTAAKNIGLSHVPCHVIESHGSGQEALLFGIINRSRQNINRNELFMAALEAEVPQAIAINSAIQRMGFIIDFHSRGRPMTIKTIVPIETLYKSGGVILIERVLHTIKAAWDTQGNATQSFIITGIGRFYRNFPHASDERLISVLRSVAPSQIRRDIDAAGKILTGSRDHIVSRVFAARYNKQLRGKRRLKL